MGLVDIGIVTRKLSDLDMYYQQIDEYSGISLSSYKSDWKTQRIVERTLQIMIEICVDIANHIISDDGMRTPATYSDSFNILTENSVISMELKESLTKMVKFRNIIVHQYEDIDAEIVVSILKKYLTDFTKFKTAVIGYLKKKQEEIK